MLETKDRTEDDLWPGQIGVADVSEPTTQWP
jgi:hypothetical protein